MPGIGDVVTVLGGVNLLRKGISGLRTRDELERTGFVGHKLPMIARAVGQLSAMAPVVIFIDDAHFAKP